MFETDKKVGSLIYNKPNDVELVKNENGVLMTKKNRQIQII